VTALLPSDALKVDLGDLTRRTTEGILVDRFHFFTRRSASRRPKSNFAFAMNRAPPS